MAEVKWIKLTTDMFDNRKIKHIRRLPEGNNIVLIWIMLLTMAGRCNSGGMIFLTENIPYTPKMLADELDFEENTVKLALEALERFGMIVATEEYFAIAGWSEHQNTEGLEKIKEQNRIRKRRQRENAAMLPDPKDMSRDMSRDCPVTSRDGHAIDIDIDKDIDKDIENIIETPKKETRHKYGAYNNVLLTDTDLEKLKTEFPDYQERIERLSEYIASTGKSYKNHLATIRSWAKKDKKQTTYGKRTAEEKNNGFCFNANEDSLDDLF
jgi:predicted phage replisome organizer